MASALDNVLFRLLPLAFNISGSIIILATEFGPAVISVVSLTGAAYISIVSISRKRQTEFRIRYFDRADNKAAIKNESISNVELLKYLCMEPYEVSRYSKAVLQTQKAGWDNSIYSENVFLLEDTIQVCGESQIIIIMGAELLLSLAVGTLAGAFLIANQIIKGQLDVGRFVMSLTYINSILDNCKLSHLPSLPAYKTPVL